MNARKPIKAFAGAACVLATLLCAPLASAATYTLPGQMPPGGCSLTQASPAVITCNNLSLQNNDVVNITAPTTIVVNGSFNQASSLRMNESGSAANLTINVPSNSVTIGQGSRIVASITSGNQVSLAFDARVMGNVTATNNIAMAQSSVIGGNATSSNGALNANNYQVTVGGNVQAKNNVSFGQNATVGGYVVSQSGNFSMSSGSIGGYLQAANGTVTTQGGPSSIGGSITAKGNVQLGQNHTVNGSITSTEGGITTNEEVHILGNVLAYGNILLGQDAVGHTTVTGNVESQNGTVTTRLRVRILGYVKAKFNIELGQQSNVGGNVQTTDGGVTTNFEVVVGGGVEAAETVLLGQATVVGQNVQSGDDVTLNYGVTINGGVSADGDVTIAQDSTVGEDVDSEGNVNTGYAVQIGGGIVTTGNVTLGQNTSVGEYIQADGSVTANGPGVTVGQYINSTGVTGPPITAPPNSPPLVTCDTDPNGTTSQNQESCPGWEDPNAPPVSHYQLVYSTPVLSCAPVAVTVKACADANCALANVSDSFTLTATGPATVSSGTQALVGGTKTVSLPLAQQGEYAFTLSLSATPQCPASASCEIDVQPAVISWQIDPLQRAGVAFPDITLLALGCAGAVPPATVMDLSFSIECVNPAVCSDDDTYFWLDGAATLETSTTFGGGIIDMDNRFRFDDAGQVRLHAHAELANGYVLDGTSAPFVVRPDSIGFSFPGALSNDTYAKAGETFSVELRALNALGEVTPNFGREVPAEKLILSETVTVPAGEPGDVTAAGSFTFDSNANTFINAALAYSESGYAAFIAQVESGDYLGSGDDLAETSAQRRFVPWAFTVNSASMGDPHSAYCANPEFSYMGKDLGMYLGFTAVNKQGARTYNYEGTQAVARARVFVTDPDSSHADLTSRLGSTPLAISWTLGQGTASSMSVNFARDTAPDGPYEGLQYAAAVEHREALNDAALGALVLPTQPANDYAYDTLPACVAGGAVCDAVAVAEPVRMLYGKFVLADTYGPEDSAAPVNLEVHYWNDATQQFARHAVDSCTEVDFDNLVMQGSLGASAKDGTGEVNVDRGRSPIGALRWTAPLVEGAFEFSYMAPAWLKDEDGNDPAARATFGRYRGHDRVLSWQLLPLPPEE